VEAIAKRKTLLIDTSSLIASIDKEFASKDNHMAKMWFAIMFRKGLMRHARV
jgi:hypothetical protein